MDESFVRQRRNLMIVSILIFLMSVAGIDFDKELTLLGFKFKIYQPIVIYISIWIMYFYFFLRYIQYYLDLDQTEKDYGSHFLQWVRVYRKNLGIWKIIKEFILSLFATLTAFIINIFVLIRNIFLGKKFFDNAFPIVFALIVGLISWNTPFTKGKREEANNYVKNIKSINEFYLNRVKD